MPIPASLRFAALSAALTLAACGPVSLGRDTGNGTTGGTGATAGTGGTASTTTSTGGTAGTGGQGATSDAGSEFHYYTGIWGSGPSDVYVTATDGTIKHSADRGATWITAAALTDKPTLYGVWGSGANDVYVFGANGQAFRSTDGGQTWSALATGTKADLQAMWGSGPEDLYLAGTLGTLLRSSDHGATWTAMALPTDDGGPLNVELRGLWGTTAGEVFVVGLPHAAPDPGVVLHWNGVGDFADGGVWLPTTTFQNTSLWDVAGSSTTDMYVATNQYHAVRSTDDGASWSVTGTLNLGTQQRLWVAGPGNVWIATTMGVAHSTDGTASWTTVLDVPPSQQLSGIWGSTTGDVYAVGINVIFKVQ